MSRIVVFGGGSFGTALAYKLAKNDKNQVIIIARNTAVVDAINNERRNSKYLGNAKYTLPANVSATSDFAAALKGVNYIVHTVPVQSSFEYLKDIKTLIPADVPIVSAVGSF
jgi:glycerol-3-phosphate dehydrogenase